MNRLVFTPHACYTMLSYRPRAEPRAVVERAAGGAVPTWAAPQSSVGAVCGRCSAETQGLCGSLP